MQRLSTESLLVAQFSIKLSGEAVRPLFIRAPPVELFFVPSSKRQLTNQQQQRTRWCDNVSLRQTNLRQVSSNASRSAFTFDNSVSFSCRSKFKASTCLQQNIIWILRLSRKVLRLSGRLILLCSDWSKDVYVTKLSVPSIYNTVKSIRGNNQTMVSRRKFPEFFQLAN